MSGWIKELITYRGTMVLSTTIMKCNARTDCGLSVESNGYTTCSAGNTESGSPPGRAGGRHPKIIVNGTQAKKFG